MAINHTEEIYFKLVNVQIESFKDEVEINTSNSVLGLSAYLTLEALLKGNQFSWADALDFSSTCTRNTISEIRKAVEYDDIENIKIPTKYSYYEEYKINDNPESIARIKKLFDYVAEKPLVQKRLERINPDWLKLQGENFGA